MNIHVTFVQGEHDSSKTTYLSSLHKQQARHDSSESWFGLFVSPVCVMHIEQQSHLVVDQLNIHFLSTILFYSLK